MFCRFLVGATEIDLKFAGININATGVLGQRHPEEALMVDMFLPIYMYTFIWYTKYIAGTCAVVPPLLSCS